MDNTTREEALDRINKANALEFMIRTEGWGILIATLEDKKNFQIDQLIQLPPGNDESVLRAHAIAFAVAHTVDDVTISVENAIQDGRNAAQVLKELGEQNTEDEFEGINW